MPANLTPQYHKAEEAYRRAGSPEEELECLQIMLREMPKHKGTDKLHAELKHKISALKKEVEHARSSKKSAGFRLPRQGAGRAVLLGGPNAGKSQLLKSLTRATPEVAPYPFTTREPMPGMMPWEDVMVQLVDTAPITADVFDAVTQGLIRGADVVVALVDLGADEGVEQFQEFLTALGGTKTRLAKESYLDEEDLGVSHTRALLAPNKIDLPQAAERLALLHEFCPLDWPEHPISAEHGQGLEALRNAIYAALGVIRVYTKLPTKKEPDYDKPFTIRQGGVVLDVAEQVHKDFANQLKYARLWGRQVHDGVQVKGDHVLHDKDVVELHI